MNTKNLGPTLSRNWRHFTEEEWLELAKQASWSASQLANGCNVTVRTLHRHFSKGVGKSLKAWLGEHRERLGDELLRNGASVKETATYLGYKQPNNFARHYKKRTGCRPSRQTPK